MYKKKRKIKFKMKEMIEVQVWLTGSKKPVLPAFELANIIAEKMGWPKLEFEQSNRREFAKLYIAQYRKELTRITVRNPRSWVYIIREKKGGHVKIGVSDNVMTRINELQTSNARELILIATIACGSRREALNVELSLHKMFDDFRIRGEWFQQRILFYLHKFEYKIDWVGKNYSEEHFTGRVLKNQEKNKE